ncbi:MAG: hypothetical protein JO235_14875 [Chroococcidiopsidaceae cyanobacterium CP_BM_RX_35]|nr:hypothetical protein [Chroococcidiopsidaceae cyanobacterium CP_BM_RX_35]
MSWTAFEAILDEFGEHRGTQIAYNKGMLEIIAPLPEHETAKVFIKRGQSEVMSSVRQAFRQWVREWLTR